MPEVTNKVARQLWISKAVQKTCVRYSLLYWELSEKEAIVHET